MNGLDHRSRADMARLACAIRLVPQVHHATVAAAIFANDLMRPQWWMRSIIAVRCGRDMVKRFELWRTILSRFPEMAAPLIEGTAAHVEDGHDRVDPASIGGFNANEVATMSGILAAVANGMKAASA